MVFKEFKQSKEGGTGYSYRPVGPLLHADIANWGFFYPTKVVYKVFSSLNYRGFLLVNTQVSPPVTE